MNINLSHIINIIKIDCDFPAISWWGYLHWPYIRLVMRLCSLLALNLIWELLLFEHFRVQLWGTVRVLRPILRCLMLSHCLLRYQVQKPAQSIHSHITWKNCHDMSWFETHGINHGIVFAFHETLSLRTPSTRSNFRTASITSSLVFELTPDRQTAKWHKSAETTSNFIKTMSKLRSFRFRSIQIYSCTAAKLLGTTL